MKSPLFAAITAAMLLVAPVSSAAQSDSLIGVWKLKSFSRINLETKEANQSAMGEHPSGVVVLTKGGYWVTVATGEGRTQAGPAPTDAERAELFKSMFAYYGTYKVDGSKVSIKVESAWTPANVGQTLVRDFTVEGKLLKIKTEPFHSPVVNAMVYVETVFERVE